MRGTVRQTAALPIRLIQMTSRRAKQYEKGSAETACSFCKRGCCHFWFNAGGQGMEVSGDATAQRLLQRRPVSKGISLFQPVVVQRWAESQLTTDAFMGNFVPHDWGQTPVTKASRQNHWSVRISMKYFLQLRPIFLWTAAISVNFRNVVVKMCYVIKKFTNTYRLLWKQKTN